jgi:hypothetical protein
MIIISVGKSSTMMISSVACRNDDRLSSIGCRNYDHFSLKGFRNYSHFSSPGYRNYDNFSLQGFRNGQFSNVGCRVDDRISSLRCCNYISLLYPVLTQTIVSNYEIEWFWPQVQNLLTPKQVIKLSA